MFGKCKNNGEKNLDRYPFREHKVPQDLLISKYFCTPLYNKDLVTKLCFNIFENSRTFQISQCFDKTSLKEQIFYFGTF